MNWLAKLNGDPLPWLLEPDPANPGVRYFALRDLLDEVGPDVVRFTMLTRKNDAPFDFDLVKATVQVGNTAPPVTVSHALYPVEQHLKTALLLELLQHTDTESVLVFTRTKHRAKRLDEQLQKAGFRAASLQGNLSQNRRQAALDGFRDGSFQILVATDIAARGIDVSQISHVINYDIPDTTEAYIHRIGRTGRAARTGDAFTLATPEDKDVIRDLERIMGKPLPRETLEGFDYDVPAPVNFVPTVQPGSGARNRNQFPPRSNHGLRQKYASNARKQPK